MNQLEIEDNLKPRLNELKTCIYCNTDLPVKSREHIFNSCWGGIHKTGQLICDTCNNSFSIIDGTFNIYTRMIMNAFQFKGQRHNMVPSLETDSPYTIGPGGKPVRDSEFKIVKKEDGMISISMNVSSKSEARKLIQSNKQEIEGLLGRSLTDEEIEGFYKMIRKSEYESVEVGTLPMKATLNLQDQYRSATHTILKCLAMFDPETVMKEELLQLKEFSRYNKGSWEDYAVSAKSMVSILNNFDSLNVKYNAVEIFYSSTLGKIVGCLKILGRVTRWVLISNKYEGPDMVLFVAEKLDGGGKVEGIRWESKYVPVPIIQVNFDKLTPQYFAEDFQKIAHGSISIDAPAAEFISKLGKLYSQQKVVSEKTAEELTHLFVEYGKTLLKLFNLKENESFNLKGYLIENGIIDIGKKYTGKPIDDSDFQDETVKLYNKFIEMIDNHRFLK